MKDPYKYLLLAGAGLALIWLVALVLALVSSWQPV